jgi:hypothetical protein
MSMPALGLALVSWRTSFVLVAPALPCAMTATYQIYSLELSALDLKHTLTEQERVMVLLVLLATASEFPLIEHQRKTLSMAPKLERVSKVRGSLRQSSTVGGIDSQAARGTMKFL